MLGAYICTVYLDYMCARSIYVYSVSRLCVLGAYIFTVSVC